jgi:AraC-like DNA-binding protein
MIYKIYSPCDYLKPYIDCYWILDATNKEFSLSVRFPPTGANGLILSYRSFKSSTSYNEKEYISARASLCGLFTSHYSTNFIGDGGFIGVLFKPGILHQAFDIDMAEISNNEFDGEMVIGSEITKLIYLIQDIVVPDLKVKALESYLINKFKLKNFGSKPIMDIIAFINENRGNIGIKEVSKYFKFSNRYLEKSFKQIVGISPKKYSNIIQFNTILKDIKKSKKINWCDLAISGGYYDQQHLINAFSKFTGLPPNKYVKQDNFYNEFYLLKKEMSKLAIL